MRTIAMLRNTWPDRIVRSEDLGAVFRYLPQTAVDSGIANLLEREYVCRLSPDGLQLTGRGRDLVEQMLDRSAAAVAELWAGHEDRVSELAPIANRCLDAAAPTGGPAFAVVFPPYEPSGAAATRLLAERLTPLRFHRFDAHVAAWEAAGLTVDQVQRLGPGPQRDALETETNRRAAAAFAAIDEGERLEFVAGLGALPG